MCVDCYRLIVMLLKLRVYLKIGLIMVVVMWVLFCLIVLFLVYVLKFKGFYCSEEWWSDYSGRMFIFIIFIVFYIILMVIMIFFYVFII